MSLVVPATIVMCWSAMLAVLVDACRPISEHVGILRAVNSDVTAIALAVRTNESRPRSPCTRPGIPTCSASPPRAVNTCRCIVA